LQEENIGQLTSDLFKPHSLSTLHSTVYTSTASTKALWALQSLMVLIAAEAAVVVAVGQAEA
jgi:hypothetical protein